jgi:hypothetical protein
MPAHTLQQVALLALGAVVLVVTVAQEVEQPLVPAIDALPISEKKWVQKLYHLRKVPLLVIPASHDANTIHGEFASCDQPVYLGLAAHLRNQVPVDFTGDILR